MEMPVRVAGAQTSAPAAGEIPTQVVARRVADQLRGYGAPGTWCSLILRVMQCLTAALAITAIVSTKHDVFTVPSFFSLVPVAAVQCVWSFSMGVLDLDAIITNLNLTNHWVARFIVFGDAITCVSTFCATSTATGVVLYIHNDLATCDTERCTLFETAVTRAYICVALLLPSVGVNWVNFWAAMFPRTPFWTDILLLYSNGTGSILSILVLFLYYSNSNTIRVTAVSFTIIAAWIQAPTCMVQLAGQLLIRHWTTTPVPDTPLLLRLTNVLQWLLAFWGLGTAWASAGVVHVFITNHVFSKDVNARAIACCALSLAKGALATLAACATTQMAISRSIGRLAQQQ